MSAPGSPKVHCYKLCGHNIVIDIASGTAHSADEVTYDVIALYETAGTAELYKSIMKKHPDVTMVDIRAILDDIEKLKEQGKLFTEDSFSDLAGTQGAEAAEETPLKALCLNVSHECNMTCAYCFVNAQPALMPFDTGKKAIDFLIGNSGQVKTLDIDFFGGEPLTNWQTVKEIVAYARMAEKFTGKRFRFTLTTNGLLIDDDVTAFTNREFHNVVLSLDGRPEVHDKMRKLPDGSGSYNEVLPKIQKLIEARRGKGYYIRGTYTRENMDFSNDILHIAGLGFTEISLEPAVAKRGSPLAFTKEDLPELFRQYDTLTIEMQRRKEFSTYVRPEDVPAGDKVFSFYHYNMDLECSPCIHKRIKGCGVGMQYLAVTPGGELYPCHQFIGDKDFLMGDVWKGITNSALRTQFKQTNICSREECRTCWARFYCTGGCAANAHRSTGSIAGVYEIGCELFKKRIENAIMMKF